MQDLILDHEPIIYCACRYERYEVTGRFVVSLHDEPHRVDAVEKHDGKLGVWVVRQTKRGTDYKHHGYVWLTVEGSLRGLGLNPELADAIEQAYAEIDASADVDAPR